MCGITGIFDTSGVSEISRDLLDRMNETQFHRGPDEGGLHLEPGVDDDLGVGMGAKAVAERFEFGHQFLEVVDFAVEHDHDRAILIEQRLLAGGQINDRQPAVAQPHSLFQVQSALVGATMKLRFIHAMQ